MVGYRPCIRSRPLLALLVIGWLIVARAPALGGVGAGGEDGAWIVVPVPRLGTYVQHLDAQDPASVSRAFNLPSAPAFMSAGAGRLVLIFELTPSPDAADGVHSYQVREVRYQRSIPNRPFTYQPQTPLAPLPPGTNVHGLAVRGRDVFVLAGRGLLKLAGGTWTELALPMGAGEAGRLRLLNLDRRPVLVRPDLKGSVAWRLIDDQGPQWERMELGPASQQSTIVSVGSQLIVGQERGGRLELSLWRETSVVAIASEEPRGEHGWIVPIGSNLGLVWSDGASSPKLSATILSPSGLVLHEGSLRSAPPVGARELEVLAVLLVSTVLSVLVFVFRPVLAPRRAITMPEGWAIAESWRRGVAGAIDGAVGLVASSVLWSMPLDEMTNPASAGFAEIGIWPLLTAAGIVILLSGLGEVLTGRTLGKLLVGIRTVSFSGQRPGLWVSLARNLVKVLCPPLALVSLMGVPPEVSPTSFGTLVISRSAQDQEPAKPEDGGQ